MNEVTHMNSDPTDPAPSPYPAGASFLSGGRAPASSVFRAHAEGLRDRAARFDRLASVADRLVVGSAEELAMWEASVELIRKDHT